MFAYKLGRECRFLGVTGLVVGFLLVDVVAFFKNLDLGGRMGNKG